MMATQRVRRLLLNAVLLLVSSSCVAGTIDVNIAMNPMDVMCGDKKIGSLKIENYYKRENYAFRGGTWSGAVMEALFTEDPAFCPKGLHIGNLKWVQAVTAGTNTIGTPPYLDPSTRDDGLPFYWTEDENSDANYGKDGTRFFDPPGQNITQPMNDITFEAGLFCVDPTTMEMKFLKGFTWGYSRADGPDADTDLDDVTLNAFGWLGGISNTMKMLIEDWDGGNDGTTSPPYKGDGTADGWKVVDDCLCRCVPEPNAGWLFAWGVVVIRGRRRARSA